MCVFISGVSSDVLTQFSHGRETLLQRRAPPHASLVLQNPLSGSNCPAWRLAHGEWMLPVKCHAGFFFFLPAERKSRTRCTKRTRTITNADNVPEQKLFGLKFCRYVQPCFCAWPRSLRRITSCSVSFWNKRSVTKHPLCQHPPPFPVPLHQELRPDECFHRMQFPHRIGLGASVWVYLDD